MKRRAGVALVLGVLLVAACDGNAATTPATAATSSTTVTLPAPTTSTSSRAPETTSSTTTVYVPDGVDADSPCLARAEFGDPSQSEYTLPYPVGETHQVTQSYCFSAGGHRLQLAYDFAMPIGTEILAARAGVVRNIKESSPDDGRRNGEHNFVFIQHDDGTTAFYAHLMQNGVEVEIGDQVETGELIGYSGNSGLTSHPHLHFGVYSSWPPTEGYDVPVNFRNADGRFDSNGGLIEGLVYEALPSADR